MAHELLMIFNDAKHKHQLKRSRIQLNQWLVLHLLCKEHVFDEVFVRRVILVVLQLPSRASVGRPSEEENETVYDSKTVTQ